MSKIVNDVYIQDDYYVNKDIEKLKLVYLSYWTQVVNDLITAYNKTQTDNWCYTLLKDSDLFSIFNVFPTDKIEVIRAFIDYNNNPCAVQLSKILSYIFKEGVTLTIDRAIITININSSYFLQNLSVKHSGSNISGLLAVKNTSIGVDDALLNVLLPIERIQSLYILRHFIPYGVELKINLIVND